MTSNFALSLSFEGIRLLHRVEDGWHLVGEVSIDADDVTEQLAELREKALLIDPGGIRTKLLIPDSQIRFISIDSAQTSLDDVHQALDGATPYGIDELVIDFDRTGGRTYIAAVARETLEEAESFAIDNGFPPVAFAAVPEPLTFRGEVFFGPTEASKEILKPGEAVVRDEVAVKITGKAVIPGQENAMKKLPEFLSRSKVSRMASAQGNPANSANADAPAAEPIEGETPDDGVAAQEVVFSSRTKPPLTASRDAPLAKEPASGDTASFSSKRTGGDTTETDSRATFASRREPPALAVPTGSAIGPSLGVPNLDAPVKPAVELVPDAPEPPAATTPVTGIPEVAQNVATRGAVEAEPKPLAASRDVDDGEQVAPEPRSRRKDEADQMTVFGARKRAVGGKPKYLGLMMTAGLILFLLLIALWAGTLSEEGLARWFGSSDNTDLVDIQTEIPAEEVAEVTAPLVVPADQVQETPAPSALAPLPVIEEEPTQPLPIVRAPTGRVLSPAEADRIYAATGVYQRAPRFAVDPRTSTLDGFQQAILLDQQPRPEQVRMPVLDAMLPDAVLPAQLSPPPPGTRYQRDLRGFILAMPDGTVTPDGVVIFAGAPELVPPVRPGTTSPAPEQVAATTDPDAPEGLILVAGRPPLVPPVRPDDLLPADEAATGVDPVDLVPLSPAVDEESVNLAATDTPIAPPADVAAVAAAVAEAGLERIDDLPEDGLETAALNLIAGRPDRTPPLRPQGLAPELAVSEVAAVNVNPTGLVTAAGVALESLRPTVRPASLVVPAPRPSVNTDTVLAGFRPALRPETAEPEEEQPSIDVIVAALAQAAPPSAFENVTARAIALSPRPDTRPRNFSQVVAQAQANLARRQTQTAAAQPQQASAQPTQQVSAAAVAPTGPVPGGVAQAATMSNAIRLRDMNLIGVYGRPNDRRALVRLGNGRYVKVEVGSSLDGGRVTAIGDSAINFVKSGRTYALQLPNS